MCLSDNPHEVECVFQVLQAVAVVLKRQLECGRSSESWETPGPARVSIGIITMYRKQAIRIQARLTALEAAEEYEPIADVKVGTVDSFQVRFLLSFDCSSSRSCSKSRQYLVSGAFCCCAGRRV